MLLPTAASRLCALAATAASLRGRTVCATAAGAPPPMQYKGAPLSEEAARERVAGKRVALYFSAGWCPMCTAFEPSLQQFLAACDDSGKPVQLVYVPSDRSEADAAARAAALDLPLVPFEQADDFKKRYNVWAGAESLKLGFGRRSGVPALVVLGSDGEELAFVAAEAQGVRALQAWPLDDAGGTW